MPTKPQLAADYQESKIKFPVIAMPKIDGVRGLHITGGLTGRSLKKHGNQHTTQRFSPAAFAGLDGEFALGDPTNPDLCRLTTSAIGRIAGAPNLTWWLFDLITEETENLPYQRRLQLLAERESQLRGSGLGDYIKLVPWKLVHTLEELYAFDDENLAAGFEGTIFRSPEGKHKNGRSTVTDGAYLRIKRFMEEDAEVLELMEGNSNQNVAQTNELGHTFRTTHQENMVPNGMVGGMRCRVLKDVYDVHSGKLLLVEGQIITVSPGKMTEEESKYYFANPEKLVLRTIKFKFFPKGVKTKPRFPTFQSIRAESDISI